MSNLIENRLIFELQVISDASLNVPHRDEVARIVDYLLEQGFYDESSLLSDDQFLSSSKALNCEDKHLSTAMFGIERLLKCDPYSETAYIFVEVRQFFKQAKRNNRG